MIQAILNLVAGGGWPGMAFLALEIACFLWAMFQPTLKRAARSIILAYWFALAEISTLVLYTAFGLGDSFLKGRIQRMFTTAALAACLPCAVSFCVGLRYRRDIGRITGRGLYSAALGLSLGALGVVVAMIVLSLAPVP
jgi:hypothetical protein